MEATSLRIQVSPGSSALYGVLAVLHARGVPVLGLHYDGQEVRILLNGSATATTLLARQVARRADVLCVQTSTGVAVTGWDLP